MYVSRRILLAAAAMLSFAATLLPITRVAAASAPPTIELAQPTFTAYQSYFEVDTGFNDWSADFTFHWTVAAPAGVCAQTVTYANYDAIGGPVDPVLGQASVTVTVPTSARSYMTHSNARDYDRGGYGVIVRITDCNGRKATSNPVHAVVLPGEDTDSALTYSAGWSTSHCTCFSGGTTHWTTTKGASVSFHTAKPVGDSGVELALIMPKASNRGSAAVYVDGVKKATVNTYSKTAVNRGIVYQILLPGTATHAVKIVNLATRGHPRIDLDATINGG
jgi:hypothetical protein